MNEIERLLAHARMNSFLEFRDEKLPKLAKASKGVKAALKMVKGLSPERAAMLVDLLEGTAFLKTVKGEPYYFKKEAGGYRAACLSPGDSSSHLVTPQGCSCEDHRLRSRVCKHMKALETLTA